MSNNDRDPDPCEAVTERLREFAPAVAERCDELRERVARIEEFGKLRRKTRRPRTTAARN
jgi:hypothetical protein